MTEWLLWLSRRIAVARPNAHSGALRYEINPWLSSGTCAKYFM
jgi:hypothetical protein